MKNFIIIFASMLIYSPVANRIKKKNPVIQTEGTKTETVDKQKY